MKLYLFILFFLVACKLSFAQHTQFIWQNCFTGPFEDEANDIITTVNGYFILGTYTVSDNPPPTPNEYNVWLINTDMSGNLQWEKQLGGTVGDYAARIFPANDGNYFIVAGSQSSDGDINNDPYPESVDYWIIKLDSLGNIIWNKILGGNGYEYSLTGVPTSDGGIIALGWTNSNDGDVSHYYGSYDMWLVKLNGAGEKVSDFTIGTSGFDFGQAIIQTSDGGFLVGGSSIPETGGNIECTPHSSKAEAIVFKLDSNFNIQWQQCYGGSMNDGTLGFLEVSDGYIIGANGESSDGDLTNSGWNGDMDIWLIKTDYFGNIIWQKCYGGTKEDFFNQIFQTNDGSMMVFGYTNSYDGDVFGNHSIKNGYSHDIWMIKISQSGDLLWQQCLGGNGDERIHFGVIQKNTSDYVIAGTSDNGMNADITCRPYQQVNNGIWSFELSDTTVSVPELLEELPGYLRIFPNPVENELNIEISEKYEIENAIMQIMDSEGRIISEQEINARKFQHQINLYSSGLYLLKLFNGKDFIYSKFYKR